MKLNNLFVKLTTHNMNVCLMAFKFSSPKNHDLLASYYKSYNNFTFRLKGGKLAKV